MVEVRRAFLDGTTYPTLDDWPPEPAFPTNDDRWTTPPSTIPDDGSRTADDGSRTASTQPSGPPSPPTQPPSPLERDIQSLPPRSGRSTRGRRKARQGGDDGTVNTLPNRTSGRRRKEPSRFGG